MSSKNAKNQAKAPEQPENAQEPEKELESQKAQAEKEPESSQETGEGELEKLKEQLAQANDKLLRLMAEYDNYRKRSQKEKAEIYPDATAATVQKFLPVLDNFDRAMQSECSDPEFRKGIEMIQTSFLECLKALQVEEIQAQGEQFDPNFHNAVMHIEDETMGENVVAQVLQKGYKIGDKVLRHAMVQVAN